MQTRRMLLQGLAALPLAAAPAFAAKRPSLDDLIARASALSTVSERMVLISHAMMGRPYRANTLIGGPKRREVFVVRDDAFDCVTLCEVVLAASLARDRASFEAALRRIRYADGEVKWETRNHYFADWTRRAVENGICQPVAIEPAVMIEKTVNWQNLGKGRVALKAISAETLLASQSKLVNGDVIGFVSRRPRLDFFHTGIIMLGRDGSLMLRHASRGRGRVADDRLDRFVGISRVAHAVLVRPSDMPAAS